MNPEPFTMYCSKGVLGVAWRFISASTKACSPQCALSGPTEEKG
ncbi:MAG: hypothetical protein QM767_13065 [Anaeromyxobacter sp.]